MKNNKITNRRIEMLKRILDVELCEVVEQQVKSPNALETLTLALKSGEISFLAARPGMLRVTLAINLMAYLLYKKKTNVLYYTFDTPAEIVYQKIKMIVSTFGNENLEHNESRINYASPIEALFNDNMFFPLCVIEDTPKFRNSDILLKHLNNEFSKIQDTIVVLDYLQLLRYTTNSNSSPLSNIDVNQQKAIELFAQLAKDKNIHIILLSDLPKKVEQRKGHKKRATPKDILDMGLPIEIFNTILLPYRPAYYGIQYWDDNPKLPTVDSLEVQGSCTQGAKKKSFLLKCYCKRVLHENLQ